MYHIYRITHIPTGQHWTQSNTTPESALDQVLLFGSSDPQIDHYTVQEQHIDGSISDPPSTWVVTYSEPIAIDRTRVVKFHRGFVVLNAERVEQLGLLSK